MRDLINNETDAQKLQTRISEYTRQHTGADLPYIDIVKAFNKLLPYGDFGKRTLFALVDLKLNFSLLLLDHFYSGAIWNQQTSMKFSNDKDIFDDEKLFKMRMEIHRHNSNYIPRYRALWDKIMGVLLLIGSEDVYEKYNSAKSRKKAFRSLSKQVSFLTEDFVEGLLNHLQVFDDNFRTAEIHRFGSLRKYSFIRSPYSKEEYAKLRASWNYLLPVLTWTDSLVDAIAPPQDV